jgi:hypothetical protein
MSAATVNPELSAMPIPAPLLRVQSLFRMKVAATAGRPRAKIWALWLAFLMTCVFVLSSSAQAQQLGDLAGDGQPTFLDLVRLINHLNNSPSLSSQLAPYINNNSRGWQHI